MSRAHVASVVVTLGVLAGLFAMHVLGLHGVQHDPSPAMATASHAHASEHASAGEASHSHIVTSSGAAHADGCCEHGHDMGVLMLCLALLVASTVLAALASRRARESLPMPSIGRLDAPAAFWRARAGPPHAMAFSVVRC